MSQADDIRAFLIEKWIKPARESSLKEVEVRAGDVHSLGDEARYRMATYTEILGLQK
jgi:hypothetical protein